MGTLLPILQHREVLFPGASRSLQVCEPRQLALVADCVTWDTPAGVVLACPSDPQLESYATGTSARFGGVTLCAGGQVRAEARGLSRFRIDRLVQREPYVLAEVHYVRDRDAEFVEGAGDDLAPRLVEAFCAFIRTAQRVLGPESPTVRLPQNPVELSYAVCAALDLPPLEKQRMLELTSWRERARLALELLERESRELAMLLASRSQPSPADVCYHDAGSLN